MMPMNQKRISESLVAAIANLDEEQALRLVRERLNAGEDPVRILEDARKAMETIGKRFEESEYYIADVIYSEEILSQVVTRSRAFRDAEVRRLGKCVIGNVASSRHDINKNIVAYMLDVNGFEIYDLGIDVPPHMFVHMIQETGAEIVALSGFLSPCFVAMRQTVEAIVDAELRESVRIMICGPQIDEHVRQFVGADGWCNDAMSAVRLAREWTRAGY